MRSFEEMNRLFAEMDRTFEQMRSNWMNGDGGAFGSGHTPALESGYGHRHSAIEGVADSQWNWNWNRNENTTTRFSEEDGSYVFVMDLPGFETEEIDLRFDDGHLQITAQTETSHGHEAEGDNESGDGDNSTRPHVIGHANASSSSSRQFRKSFPIPKPVVEAEISASYHNGVLEVRLPLIEDEAETGGHRIDIE